MVSNIIKGVYVCDCECVNEILKQSCVYSFLHTSLCYGPYPSFMDIWSKWRLNYDYANFAESYILHSSHLYYYHFTWFDQTFAK